MSAFSAASKMKGALVKYAKTGLSARAMICPLILAALLPAFSGARDAGTEKSAIERVIRGSIGCAKEKDFGFSIMSSPTMLTRSSLKHSHAWRQDTNREEQPSFLATLRDILFFSKCSYDGFHGEVDPGDGVVRGFNEFRKREDFWGSADCKAIRYNIRDLQVMLSNSGDVAWFSCMLDDVNEWKVRPASWVSTRWTGVLEKRGDHWVIVRMHFSFACDK